MTVATTGCRIKVDMGRCSGLGLCEAEAPDHFEIGDDGQLTVLSFDVTDRDREEVEAAVRTCPTQAITIED
ncbi:ferredoxin [Gordonia sp. L191]|uniref:ferredoxin n=1 Tax=Gordonia sp. L191 TaxID=2982699 RepID=UPI0024BF927B|nr:ferredoxin [Gordonia sp. L191]WHU45827.1 ferredoxin [Gordonia sp. L191]